MGASFDLSRAIGLAAAAREMRGRYGRAPSIKTVYRWADPARGYSAAGTPVVLETRRVNGELLTMPEWVEEFEQRRGELGARRPAATLPRTSKQRVKAVERADASLDEARVGTKGKN